MQKEELELILKSVITDRKYGNLEFEYTFLDIKQVKKRVEWFRYYTVRITHLEKDYPIMFGEYRRQHRLSYEEWLLNKAFEEII